MFYEVELLGEVAVLPEILDQYRLVPTRTAVTRLLEDLLREKADKDLRYFLAVTGLKRIGKGEVVDNSGDVFFPAVFNCRMFLPCKVEIMEGVVHHIYRLGVFYKLRFSLRSENAKLPLCCWRKSSFFERQPCKDREGCFNSFQGAGSQRIEIREDIRKEFVMLASLEGDSLGPLTLPGPDGLHL